MRIIKKGKLPEEKEYIVSCSYCGSKLAYKESDAIFGGLYLGKFVLAIRCPVCSKQIVDYREG